MTIEAVISLGAAWSSHSPALFAFGGDSMIELLSAAVVFWRFRFELSELRAARIAGILLFTFVGLVMLTSVLNFIGYREAQRNVVGIATLLAAAVVMPWLAGCKRKLAVNRIKRRFEGRRCRICPLRFHGMDRSWGTHGERHVE